MAQKNQNNKPGQTESGWTWDNDKTSSLKKFIVVNGGELEIRKSKTTNNYYWICGDERGFFKREGNEELIKDILDNNLKDANVGYYTAPPDEDGEQSEGWMIYRSTAETVGTVKVQ